MSSKGSFKHQYQQPMNTSHIISTIILRIHQFLLSYWTLCRRVHSDRCNLMDEKLLFHDIGENLGKKSGRGGTLRRRIKPLLLLGAVIVATMALFLEGPWHAAYAYGPGRVCVFYAPTGADVHSASGTIYAGHVGWGFRVGQQDSWVYGATEGPSNDPTSGNGAWMSTGDEATMYYTFQNYGQTRYYTLYTCKDTLTSAVGSAVQTAQKIPNQGFDGLTNNCLTDAVQILDAYDSSLRQPSGIQPSRFIAVTYTAPADWFFDLPGFDPVKPLPLVA